MADSGRHLMALLGAAAAGAGRPLTPGVPPPYSPTAPLLPVASLPRQSAGFQKHMASAGRLDSLEVEDESQLLHSPEGCPLSASVPIQIYDTQGSADAVCDGVLFPSKAPSQLEVTPITMYNTAYSEALGSSIAVNKRYVCYGLAAGQIRVLDRDSGARALLKGHSKAVLDAAFFSEEEDLLASVAEDLSLLVWRIAVNVGTLVLEGERLMAVQLQLAGGAAPPASTNRVCWHPSDKNMLVYGGPAGACLLTIDTLEAARVDAAREEGATDPAHKLKLVVDPSAAAPCGVTILPAPTDAASAAVTDVSVSPDGARVLAAMACGQGHHNHELKLWVVQGEGTAASSQDVGASPWACVHQVFLVSSGGRQVADDGDAAAVLRQLAEGTQEAFFNHVLVAQGDGYSLVVLANTRKNAVYTLSVVAGDGSHSPLAHFEYLAEFAVVLPILSGAALPSTRPVAITGTAGGSGQQAGGPVEPVVQLFCVQTTAVQQYALFVTQCVPEDRARQLLGAAAATHEQSLEAAAAEELQRAAEAKVPKSAAVVPNRSYAMAATPAEMAAVLAVDARSAPNAPHAADKEDGPAAAPMTPPPSQRPLPPEATPERVASPALTPASTPAERTPAVATPVPSVTTPPPATPADNLFGAASPSPAAGVRPPSPGYPALLTPQQILQQVHGGAAASTMMAQAASGSSSSSAGHAVSSGAHGNGTSSPTVATSSSTQAAADAASAGAPAQALATEPPSVPGKRAGLLHLGKLPPGFPAPAQAPTTTPAEPPVASSSVGKDKDKGKAAPLPAGKARNKTPPPPIPSPATPAVADGGRLDASGATAQALGPATAPSAPPMPADAGGAATATKPGSAKKGAALDTGLQQVAPEAGAGADGGAVAAAVTSRAELESLLSRPLPFGGAPSHAPEAAAPGVAGADDAGTALLSLLRGATGDARVGGGAGAQEAAAAPGVVDAGKGAATEAAEKQASEGHGGAGHGGEGVPHKEPRREEAQAQGKVEAKDAVREAPVPHPLPGGAKGVEGETLARAAAAAVPYQEAKGAAAAPSSDAHKVTQTLMAHMASVEKEMVAIRKELISQAAAQKTAATSASALVLGALAKEAKKLELAIGTRVDKAIKGSLDAHAAAVEDTLARRDKAEAERHDKLLSAVTNTWPQEVPPLIQKAVKKELGALVLGLGKGITPSLQTTVTKAAEASLAKALTKSLPSQVDKALAPQLDAMLQRLLAPADVTAALQGPLMEGVRQQFAASLLPAVEATCRELFGQLDATLMRGLDEHFGTLRAERAAAMGALDTALRDAQAVASQLGGEMRELQREVLAAAMEAIQAQAQWAGRGGNGGPAAGGAGAPEGGAAKMLSLEHLESRLDPTIELRRLLDEGSYEEAFNRALTLADLSVVTWVCRQVDVSQLLGGEPPALSQGVLLSLVSQLATDVVADTGMKLSWVREAAMALDVADPLYAPHLRPILESVHKSIAQQAPAVAPEWRSQVKLVLHIMTSLLAQVA
eukprot:jgi/Mesvir1/16435/Mv18157-RA.2